MASVRSVGARIYVTNFPDEVPIAPGSVHFSYQFFADLEIGRRVMALQSSGLQIPRAAVPQTLEELSDMVLKGVRNPSLSAEHRASHWGHLAATLAAVGVQTDSETLMRLPFRLEASDDVLELLS